MRNDERFEIERAFDVLPHIVGSSWTVIWFRLNKIKEPTREEYRKKIENSIYTFPRNLLMKWIINITVSLEQI